MIIKLYHSRLQSVDDQTYYKRECPFCNRGMFLVHRDNETFKLEEDDYCISCGQGVQYLDIKEMRVRDNNE